MIVLILEKVPIGLRGELTRWMIEPKSGVFVGNVSGMVRDRLWEMACAKMHGGAGMMLQTANNEQGYSVRFWGKTKRRAIDHEGLTLIEVDEPPHAGVLTNRPTEAADSGSPGV